MQTQIKKRNWRAIAPLFCVLLLNAASIGFIMPELGPMLLNHTAASIVGVHTSKYLRHWYYGATLSLPVVFMFVGSPFWGAVSDSIGRKKILLIALFGEMISCLISAGGIEFKMVWLLLLGQASVGLMDASESTAQAAMVDISEDQDKAKNMSIISLAFTLGFIIGPIFGGYFSDNHVVSWFNYQTPFYFAAILAALNIVFLSFSFKETYKPKQHERPSIKQSFCEIGFAFKLKEIRKLAWIFLCMELGWALYFQSISLSLVEWFHYTPQKIGLFMAGIAICFSFTLLVVLRILLRYISRKKIICTAFLIAAITPLIELFYAKELWIWLAIIPMTVGIGLLYNTLLSLLSDAASRTQQGRMMGIATAVAAIGFALSALLIGLLSSVSLQVIFIIILVTVVTGFALMLKQKTKYF